MSFLIVYIVASLVLALSYLTQLPVLVSLVVAFLVIPTLDVIFGKQEKFELSDNEDYDILLFAWAPFQIIALCLGLNYVRNMELLDALMWSVPFGLVNGGIGITVAHEIGHRWDKASQLSARILLTSVCYPHFTIEHNLGHHLNVATAKDPATAKKNESLWMFILRTVPQQYIDAWKIENRRMKRRGISIFSLTNRMIWCTILPLLTMGVVWFTFSITSLAFFILQSVVAVFLLESINYIEHYGLTRKEKNGKYEKVNIFHSWDANYWFTNHLLFRLQQHADHHANSNKKYTKLENLNSVHLMPFGYPSMVLIAMVPPLWKKIMNPRLESKL